MKSIFSEPTQMISFSLLLKKKTKKTELPKSACYSRIYFIKVFQKNKLSFANAHFARKLNKKTFFPDLNSSF